MPQKGDTHVNRIATFLIGALAATSVLSVACTGTTAQQAPAPTSVIVFIADGAGVAHWTLASLANPDLSIRRMPVAGLVRTSGPGHEVTGSAPAATALATGVRTFMGAVGVGPDSLPRETALEVAHALGWATGLVTTTWLMDATPASFGAHSASRAEFIDIFQQFIDRPVEVLLGGGARIFAIALERESLDFRPMVSERYTEVTTAEALEAASSDAATTMILGLFADGDLPLAPERSPNLSAMTHAALEVLSRDPDGFFLMVENEGSDTEAHRNSSRDVLTAEMLGFDAAVGVALDFQVEHSSTLVLVVSDHETGGITLPGDENRDAILTYETGDHTAAMVPLFAIGPGAERFGGLHDNDEVGRALLDLIRR